MIDRRYCLCCFTENPQGLYCAACQQQAHSSFQTPEHSWFGTDSFPGGGATTETALSAEPRSFIPPEQGPLDLQDTPDAAAPPTKWPAESGPRPLDTSYEIVNPGCCVMCGAEGAAGLCEACRRVTDEVREARANAVQLPPVVGPNPLIADVSSSEERPPSWPQSPGDEGVPFVPRPEQNRSRERGAGEYERKRYCLICFTENPQGGLYCVACRKQEEERARELLSGGPTDSRHRGDTLDYFPGLEFAPHEVPERPPGRFYPEFQPPQPDETALVLEMAILLQTQCDLNIDPIQILEAPPVYGASRSRRTSEGWLRDADSFWAVLQTEAPHVIALLHGGRTVTSEYADFMGWPSWSIGQPLEHHHIHNSRFVVPLPRNVHDASVHRTPQVVSTP
jgi:hypothetical protein